MTFRRKTLFGLSIACISISFFVFELLASESRSEITTEGEVMGYGEAFVYGIIEGITEFLPISSTGHLVVASHVMHPDSDKGREALNAYLIVIQAGAILAVTLIYRNRIWMILMGIFGFDKQGRNLGVNLIFAFLPAAMLGPFLDEIIESLLFGLLPIAFALFAGAIFMYWAEKRKKAWDRANPDKIPKKLEDINYRESLFVGFLQCFAMWPGTSRSMMTIVGGYLIGLKREQAAEFSFLLGVITLTAAAGYKTLTKWEVMFEQLELGSVFFGCLVAGISAAASVYWLVGYLSKRGLGLFVWYRIALSILIVAIYFWP